MPKLKPKVLGLLVLCALISLGGRGQQAAEPGLASLALDLVNGERKSRGLSLLDMDAALCRAASAHAEDMLARDYFDHLSPEGQDVMDRYAAAGGNRWLGVAENIFKCRACPDSPGDPTVRMMHKSWMESRDHREAILSPKHGRFCFGLAADPEKGYAAVQTFAGPGRPRQLGAGSEPRILSQEELRALALSLINDRRRAQGRRALSTSAPLASDAEAFLAAELTRDPAGRDPLSPARVRSFLSGHDGGAWLRVGVLLEACGGCGIEATDADVSYFIESWFGNEAFRTTLLEPRFDSFGIAIAADGQGRKVALGLFGDQGG